MFTKQFITLEDAETFIKEMSAKDVVLDAYQDTDRTYKVNWVENKKYTAHDGKEFNDEVWITIDNKMIHVQDLEAEHARNIIRMMLRNRRNYLAQTKEIFGQLEEALADMLTDDKEDAKAPAYLH